MIRTLGLLLLSLLCRGSEMVPGTILDPSGQAATQFVVEIRTPTGQTLQQLSSSDGTFLAGPLAEGSYSLTVMAAGFARLTTPFAVPIAEPLSLTLQVAPVEDSISVTASRGEVTPVDRTERMAFASERNGVSRATGWLANSLPGVLPQQTGTAQLSPFLRGLTGYQVLLTLIDGVRFNNSTFRSGPNQYLAWIDAAQVERVEATLGPSSSQYGSDSLGGTVQLLTREPAFGSGRRPEWHGEANLFGGSADFSGGSDALVNVAASRWSWLNAAAVRRHNDLRAGGGSDSHHVLSRLLGLDPTQIRELLGSRQRDTAYSQSSAQSKFVGALPRAQSVSLLYQRGEQYGVRNTKDLWGGLGRLRSNLAPQRMDFGYLRYENSGWGPLTLLSATASLNRQTDGSERQGLRTTDVATTDRSTVNSAGYGVQASRLRAANSLVWGGEVYRESIASRRTDLVQGNPIVRRPLFPDGSRYRNSAAFLQGRRMRGSRLALSGGVRWTGVSFRAPEDPATGVAQSSQRFRDWTYQASASWTWTPTMALHALFGRGFRAPNANDLGTIGLNDLGYEVPASQAPDSLLGSSAGEGAVSLGRPAGSLRPESLLNYEAGWRWNTRVWSARLQVFDAELFDPIVRRTLLFPSARVPSSLAGLPVTAIPPTPAQLAQEVVTVATAIDPRAVKAFVNDGRSRYHGGESLLRWNPGSRWRVDAGYSYLTGRDLNPNRNVRRLPPQHGSLALSHSRNRWWWRMAVAASGAQTRLSGGDLDDERIGASRSRADIAAFLASARLSPWVRNGVFVPTGETLERIQDRVLPGTAPTARVPLYRETPGWWTWSVQAGVVIRDDFKISGAVQNILDRNYRIHGSGVDAPGRHAFLSLSYAF